MKYHRLGQQVLNDYVPRCDRRSNGTLPSHQDECRILMATQYTHNNIRTLIAEGELSYLIIRIMDMQNCTI